MIFVTGGTGMVGAHLLYDLIRSGEKVRALKRPSSNIQKTEAIFSFYSNDYHELFEKIEWVEGDILEKESLIELLSGVDQVYHVAAMVSFNPKDREQMIGNNCIGTANLLDLSLLLHIPRFCYVSSIAAIGSPPDGIEANELHPWHNDKNHSNYSESKYLSEMEVWRAIIQGLDVVIVNPSVILGPGNWNSGSASLFRTVSKGMKFYTKGGTGFVDIRDVTQAMQQLMQEDNWNKVKNHRYILNAENVLFRNLFSQIAVAMKLKPPKYHAGITLLKLVGMISQIKGMLTGKQPSLTRDTIRSANKISCYDGSKICREIGFSYTSIEDSIRRISKIYMSPKRV